MQKQTANVTPALHTPGGVATRTVRKSRFVAVVDSFSTAKTEFGKASIVRMPMCELSGVMTPARVGSPAAISGAMEPPTRLVDWLGAGAPCPRLEYIVVHEMTHLLEPTHNARFVALMDSHMPQWHHHRQTLNRLPVRHEDWEY